MMDKTHTTKQEKKKWDSCVHKCIIAHINKVDVQWCNVDCDEFMPGAGQE